MALNPVTINPATLAAQGVLTAVPEIIALIQGNKQIKQGKAIQAANKQPVYNIPTAEKEYLGMERQNYLAPYSAGMKYAENQLDSGLSQSLNNVVQSGASPAEIMAAVTGLAGVKQKGVAQNAAMFQDQYNQNRMSYGRALEDYAGFQDKTFQLNKLLPFERNAAAGGALINAGNMNKMNALRGLSGGLSSILPIGTQDNTFIPDNLTKTTTVTNTPTPEPSNVPPVQKPTYPDTTIPGSDTLPQLPDGTIDYSKITQDMLKYMTPEQQRIYAQGYGVFGNYTPPSYGSPVVIKQ